MPTVNIYKDGTEGSQTEPLFVKLSPDGDCSQIGDIFIDPIPCGCPQFGALLILNIGGKEFLDLYLNFCSMQSGKRSLFGYIWSFGDQKISCELSRRWSPRRTVASCWATETFANSPKFIFSRWIQILWNLKNIFPPWCLRRISNICSKFIVQFR